MASATLEGLFHRSTVLNIKGDSYRLADRKKAARTTEAGSNPVTIQA